MLLELFNMFRGSHAIRWLLIISLVVSNASGDINANNMNNVEQGTLVKINFNPSGLTITSFMRRTGRHSSWVDHIFGNRSVFNSPKEPGALTHRQDGATAADIALRHENVRKVFTFPPEAETADCSVEMLGFVPLDKHRPFKEGRRDKPIFGSATLQVPSTPKNSNVWNCFYRAVYEQWRLETDLSKPNFWAVLFYCPAQDSAKDCPVLDSIFDGSSNQGSVLANVVMPISETATFSTKFFVRTGIEASSVKRDRAHNNEVGVCLPIPYTSSDKEKQAANDAILSEWIRYYSELDFRIFIYDRDGANYNVIYDDNAYKRANKINVPTNDHTTSVRNSPYKVHYYNYTLRGKLDPEAAGLSYDNTELTQGAMPERSNDRRHRHQKQGYDKVLTLTHCRFEAKALYGLENVFVIDYDEFLFCPVGGPTIENQAEYIHKFLSKHKREGVEQLTFAQRQTLNHTESPRDCMIENVKATQSVFDCFSPYEFYMGSHSSKAFHLSTTCPLTGYHQACPAFDIPFSHDCFCNAKAILSNPFRPYNSIKDRECGIVHISSNTGSYNPVRYKYEPEEIARIRQMKNSFKKALGL
jgi:hypothetical protein